MTDIVERLRASNSAGMLCDEAAGEIEWLRQEHERLKAALREVDSQLMNMQPHIASLEEHCGNVGRTRFIDDHVDVALDAVRKALEANDD